MSSIDPTTTTIETEADSASAPPDVRHGVLRRTFRAKRAWIGAIALALITLWAFVGPLLAPYNATDSDVLAFGAAPGGGHWFGTNDIGQDVYAQTLVGLQKSIIIGLIAGPLATLIAGFVGAIAGYFGGVADRVIVWVIDLLLVIPSFFILVLVSPIFKQLSWVALVVLISVFSWMIMARVVRGQTMSLRERDFVKAARYMGVKPLTIIRRHIIPNVASLLIIDATLGVGAAIIFESTLSYFGFGIQVPDVSLGSLLASYSNAAVTRPWLFALPAATLIATVLATSLLGDAFRDAIDPTSGANRD
ncbi:ABC transporter permease [Schumannella soli]|uniref:Oligopeptide transport system permease protein OppC n=1 Tax=Schumannella soli TaxID=2590779 RepID=A0A506Y1Q2_9MICO|nr:ABC transporter permease [Schumannella soli]TPW75823.1 ABC transporter permease [Schumannella soli]